MKTNIRKASAYTFTILILLVVILHAYWALGGSWFLHEASGGEIASNASLPYTMRLVTWALIMTMVVGVLLVLGRAKIIWPKVSPKLYAIPCWTITVCMFLGALLNFAIPRFWDRFVFGPIFLILFILCIIIALPGKGST
jgi:hypothetical protein